MRIGIDVGGTNTDAVLLDGTTVLAAVKTSTTADVTSGIVAALDGLQRQRAFDPADVRAVMIGTTHFINALVRHGGWRRRRPCGSACRPARRCRRWSTGRSAWSTAVSGRSYLVHGGHEFDGRHIAELDESRAAQGRRGHGRGPGCAVSRSPRCSRRSTPSSRRAPRRSSPRSCPACAISLSHEIGRIGLLERENATIINAALRELAAQHRGRAGRVGRPAPASRAPLYLSQNDGTLMDVDFARRYPVATFASGPTNSMRGAAVLSGLDTCAVVDVGGTTTDVGVLSQGFPREATTDVSVAGIRTNFRMPDVLSIGLGGGSLVRGDATWSGPDSVGYELTDAGARLRR